MADRRGDYSKKSTTYKFYKKGYSSSKPKYVTAGQDLLIEQEVSGSIIGSASAGAGYSKGTGSINIYGNGDSNSGLNAEVVVRTDSARPFDLKGIVAQFSHGYFVSNHGTVSNYSVYLFDYRVTRNVSANTLSLYYKDGLVNSVTMSTDYDWLRLREVNGTVYIDRSADGTTWTNWATQAVQADDARVSIMKVTADIGAGGLGDISVGINNIDISDASNNLLAVESKKVLNDLSFTKNINTPAASTSLEMDYSPKDLPDSDVSLERIINHSTNPSFETGSGTVEVRRNYALNPRGATATTNYSTRGNGSYAGTVSRLTGQSPLPGVTTAVRATSTASPSSWWQLEHRYTVPPSGKVAVSFRARSSINGNLSLHIFCTGGDSTLDALYDTAAATSGVWVTKSAIVTVPNGTTEMRVGLRRSSADAPGNTLDMSCLLVEAIDTVLPYFDGSINDGFDTASLTPAWTGTANASESVLNGTAPVGGNSWNGTVTPVRWLSSDSPNHGSKFMRILMKHSSYSTVAVADTTGVSSGEERTYIGNYRANRVQTVQPRWNSSTGIGGSSELVGGTFTLSTDWSELRRTGTTTHNNASLDFAMNNAQAGDIIDIDNHMVVKGDYTGAYFDGSTSANTGWLNDGTSYKDNFTDKYAVENSHLLFGNTIEAIVGYKTSKDITPENKNILKFSGYIDAIDRDYNNDVISVTAISHGEILSNVLVGYADENVKSTLISQTAQNANESTTNRRQTFIPRVATKLSGARVRLTYAGGGSATLTIGTGSTILASSKTMTWSGPLSAGVYDLALLSPIFLEAGKTYWLSVDGIVNWYYQNTNVYADGSRQQLSGGTWSNVTGDAYFELYTSNPSVVFEYSGSVEGLVDRVFQETDSNYGLVSKGTVVNPSYNIGVNAAVDSGRSLLETALKMSPIGYWSSIDLGSGEYDLKPYPTTAEHTLIFGRDFTEFNLSEAISNIVNDVPFIGGDIDSVQTKLAIRTNDRASMGAYKLGLSVESNGKVTRYDSAQLLSDYEIQNNNKPRQTTSIVIPASEYDIETFDTGQLVKILNADSEQLVKGLLIASVDYTPERAILSLDSAPQTITSSVDKIKRDLNNSETSGVSGVI